jgi:hypothetical protein
MNEKKGLLSSGLGKVMHNKRYLVWFWLLNLALAEFGTAGFRKAAHATLDHSLYAGGLLRGFDASIFAELLTRPSFGSMASLTTPAIYFSVLFAIATAIFLPGVFAGYASTYRLPREDFFRACGRNLWRYIRIMIVAGILMGIAAGVLFGINSAIVKKAGESTNELLPVKLNFAGLAVIFLVMTAFRIWFDLAEVDAVLNDQRAVRKSIWAGLKHTFRGLFRLMTAYVLITIMAAIFLVGGLGVWMRCVAPENWVGAYLMAQLVLFLLLIPRFWQRGAAVSYWQQYMLAPVVEARPITPPVMPVVTMPLPSPVTPSVTEAPASTSAAEEPKPPAEPGSGSV